MHITPMTLAFIGNIGWPEITILALLGVLIFGRRLPEVGRSLGKGIIEFKKGLSGIDDQVNKSIEDRPVSEKGQLKKNQSTSTSTKVSQPTPTAHTKDS